MSTTGTNEPRRQRRNRLNLPSPRRGDRGQGAPRPAAPPAAAAPPAPATADRNRGRLIRTARRTGKRAAKRRAFDPWTLQNGDRPPYLAQLAAERDSVVGGINAGALQTEARERLADDRAGVEITTHEAETAVLDERLRETDGQILTARRQLDLLARRTNRWNRFRDVIRVRLESQWARLTFPAATGPAGARGDAGPGGGPPAVPAQVPRTVPDEEEADGLQTVPRTGEAPRSADGTGAGPAAPGTDPHTAAGQDPPSGSGAWEGLTKRPGIPSWMSWAMLAVLILVEAPIYWAAFQPFHGVGTMSADAQTITLAGAAAVVMVFLPHLAGRLLRWRAGTGAIRLAWLPALTLLGVWVALTVLFGVLRTKFVTQGEEISEGGGDGFAGADSGPATTLLDRLDLTAHTVTAMFCALLILSGGIGFLLGLFREHPYLDSYRTAVERRERLVRRRTLSIAATERARAVRSTADARREDRRHATEERVRAVQALYDEAAAAYLNSLAEESRDPAMTEAAMKLTDRWPLLPARGRNG
ncbi:hypothetical protein AB0M23_26400 [Streptomyces sp. NPDC052077]|uniref:hypothetical protein n=1 Tax=Streptomyces sp. NPDC052077 TaxID=3154757 RepID=UPI0034257552